MKKNWRKSTRSVKRGTPFYKEIVRELFIYGMALTYMPIGKGAMPELMAMSAMLLFEPSSVERLFRSLSFVV